MTEGGGEWGTKKKKKEERLRERENHSPSIVGKANDLSQPLLSPRLAERKLPAVPHAFVTDYNLLKISTRNMHRKKSGCTCPRLQQLNNYLKERKREKKRIIKKKKKREKKPVLNSGQRNCSPARYRLLYGEASRSWENLCLYCFSVSFTAAFSCSVFIVFLK